MSAIHPAHISTEMKMLELELRKQLRDLVAELQGQLADAHQLLQTKSVQVLELELQLKKCGREALDKDHQIALLKAGAPKQVDPPVIENRAFHDTEAAPESVGAERIAAGSEAVVQLEKDLEAANAMSDYWQKRFHKSNSLVKQKEATMKDQQAQLELMSERLSEQGAASAEEASVDTKQLVTDVEAAREMCQYWRKRYDKKDVVVKQKEALLQERASKIAELEETVARLQAPPSGSGDSESEHWKGKYHSLEAVVEEKAGEMMQLQGQLAALEKLRGGECPTSPGSTPTELAKKQMVRDLEAATAETQYWRSLFKKEEASVLEKEEQMAQLRQRVASMEEGVVAVCNTPDSDPTNTPVTVAAPDQDVQQLSKDLEEANSMTEYWRKRHSKLDVTSRGHASAMIRLQEKVWELEAQCVKGEAAPESVDVKQLKVDLEAAQANSEFWQKRYKKKDTQFQEMAARVAQTQAETPPPPDKRDAVHAIHDMHNNINNTNNTNNNNNNNDNNTTTNNNNDNNIGAGAGDTERAATERAPGSSQTQNQGEDEKNSLDMERGDVILAEPLCHRPIDTTRAQDSVHGQTPEREESSSFNFSHDYDNDSDLQHTKDSGGAPSLGSSLNIGTGDIREALNAFLFQFNEAGTCTSKPAMEVQLASVRDILRLVGELSEEQQRWRKGAAVRAISRVDPEHWHTMHCIVYKDSDEFGLVHLKASLAKLVALATTGRLVVRHVDNHLLDSIPFTEVDLLVNISINNYEHIWQLQFNLRERNKVRLCAIAAEVGMSAGGGEAEGSAGAVSDDEACVEASVEAWFGTLLASGSSPAPPPTDTLAYTDVSRLPDAFARLFDSVLPAKSCALKRLDLRGCGLALEECERLGRALQANWMLEEIDIRDNNAVNDTCLAAIGSGFHQGTRVSKFLSSVVSTEDVAVHVQAPSNTILDLRPAVSDASLGVGKGALVLLGMVLRNSKAISEVQLKARLPVGEVGKEETLKWDNLGIGSQDGFLVAGLIKFCYAVDALKLQENELGSEGALVLAEILTVGPGGLATNSLRHLDVRNNGILGPSAARLAAAVASHPTLDSFNQIPVGGLRDNTLEELDLYGSAVGLVGALVLAYMLRANTSLQALDLSEEDVTHSHRDWAGVHELASALLPDERGVFNVSLHTLVLTDRELPLQVILGEQGTVLDLANRSLNDADAVSLAYALRFTTSLTWLNLSHNTLGPWGAKAVSAALQTNAKHVFNQSIRTLDLSHNCLCGISSVGVGVHDVSGLEALVRVLQPREGGGVTAVDVSHNRLGPQGAKVVADAIRSKPGGDEEGLCALGLQSNALGADGSTIILERVERCVQACDGGCSLTELNLAENGLDDGGVDLLERVLRQGEAPVFNSLDVRCNTYGPAAGLKLAGLVTMHPNHWIKFNGVEVNALKSDNPLQIKFHDGLIGMEGLVVVADVLRCCDTANTLDVANCRIAGRESPLETEHVVGIDRLSHALQESKALTYLDLSRNYMGPRGVVRLVAGLKGSSVIALKLAHNCMGDEGAFAFSNVIAQDSQPDSCKLQSLDLSANGIGVAGLESLAEPLRQNQSLDTLDLADNDIACGGTDMTGLEALAVALSPVEDSDYNTTVNELNLAGNVLGSDGAMIIVDMLPDYPHGLINGLDSLDIRRTQIDKVTSWGLRKLSRADVKLLLDYSDEELDEMEMEEGEDEAQGEERDDLVAGQFSDDEAENRYTYDSELYEFSVDLESDGSEASPVDTGMVRRDKRQPFRASSY